MPNRPREGLGCQASPPSPARRALGRVRANRGSSPTVRAFFVEPSWPKLIGYGKKETKVLALSRCSSTEELVMALLSRESNLVGNLNDGNHLSITKFDPATEEYKWYKIMKNVNRKNKIFIQYTPDCSKIFLFSWKDSAQKFVYLDP